MDNVWIGGNDVKDAHLLKFSRSGQFLLQLGKPEQNQGSNDPVNFWRVAEISIDADARTRRTSPTATATSASS